MDYCEGGKFLSLFVCNKYSAVYILSLINTLYCKLDVYNSIYYVLLKLLVILPHYSQPYCLDENAQARFGSSMHSKIVGEIDYWSFVSC